MGPSMANVSPVSTGAKVEAAGDHPARVSRGAGFWGLTIGSVGVVYGDIGTSPLYAFREAARAAAADGILEPVEILGVLSLIFWSLTIIVTLKYVLILTRADNHGEGGTLALMALAQRAVKKASIVILLGIIAAALFYGDAVITPALSVLSAVEGLEVVAPNLTSYILPLSVLILVTLFLVQSRGTAIVSAFFGPVTVVWFIAIGLLGLYYIAGNPAVLMALSPIYAVGFLAVHGVVGLITLGAVFLAVTGPRRSTPISATSAAGRSRRRGWGWCCRRWCSTISARARSCWRIPKRWRIRSS